MIEQLQMQLAVMSWIAAGSVGVAVVAIRDAIRRGEQLERLRRMNEIMRQRIHDERIKIVMRDDVVDGVEEEAHG